VGVLRVGTMRAALQILLLFSADLFSSVSVVVSAFGTAFRRQHPSRLIRCNGGGGSNNVQQPIREYDQDNRNQPPITFVTNTDVGVPKVGGRGVVLPADRLHPLSLGAPPADRPRGGTYETRGGITVSATVRPLHRHGDTTTKGDDDALTTLLSKLDSQRGVLLDSSYEFPGRYARWSIGLVNPPIAVEGYVGTNQIVITALNERGQTVLLPAIYKALQKGLLQEEGLLSALQYEDQPQHHTKHTTLIATVVPPPPAGTFSEEERSKQPSLFSVVRALVNLFAPVDPNNSTAVDGGQLGLYGAFGYDLTFQFEPIQLKQTRQPHQRDLVLYLPDEILVVDKQRNDAWTISYEFETITDEQKSDNDTLTKVLLSTLGMERNGSIIPFQPYDETHPQEDDDDDTPFEERDTPQHQFASSVERAKQEFAVGNLFEAVLSQTFRHKCGIQQRPSVLFTRLKARNPSPYGFCINLGRQEYLVGASPEMFVRCERAINPQQRDNNDEYYNDEQQQPQNYPVNSIRVETCPISGTVARGADALEDAQRIKSLIGSAKEESELTMCTDVDRNDKSRICIPGSVKVIGRRQIEMYSRLIHTVDHVEGYLRPEFDSLDAFLCHTWAVTVTGAPKTWAIQFVEDMERSPRCWYGGAVGLIGFDGGLNTGLTLRTVRVHNGIAEVRAGATLLYDSNPTAEELETELKASAMIDAIVHDDDNQDGNNKNMDGTKEASTLTSKEKEQSRNIGFGKKLILIDHEDSFVHTLGNYLRQTGAEVETLRSGPTALATIERMVLHGTRPDMVVLSPGPGNPSDFGLSQTLELLSKHSIPTFGVCLGLQGMVEYFGGQLGILSYPMHGKPSMITLTTAGKAERSIFSTLPDTFEVARYHSLHGLRDKMPSCLEITAISDDGIVMGIQHKELPMAAVQFHPESILTSPFHGMTILKNVLKFLK